MKILIVEDDTLLLQGLILAAQTEGYACDGVTTARMAEQSLEAGHYSLVVLDLGLPDEDGLHFLARIRQKKYTLPVLILTARDTLTDKIAGLDVGADDYLVKPFELEELVARLNALCRRQGQYSAEKLRYGAYTLESSTYCLAYGERRVELRPREFKLLELLLRNRGQVMPRAVLQDRIWGIDSDVTENNLDVHIRLLRKKIMELNGEELIKTMRGVGYYVE